MLNKVPLIMLLMGNSTFPHYEADFDYYLLHTTHYQSNQHINKLKFIKYNEITRPKGSIQLHWRTGSFFSCFPNQTDSADGGGSDSSISEFVTKLLN